MENVAYRVKYIVRCPKRGTYRVLYVSRSRGHCPFHDEVSSYATRLQGVRLRTLSLLCVRATSVGACEAKQAARGVPEKAMPGSQHRPSTDPGNLSRALKYKMCQEYASKGRQRSLGGSAGCRHIAFFANMSAASWTAQTSLPSLSHMLASTGIAPRQRGGPKCCCFYTSRYTQHSHDLKPTYSGASCQVQLNLQSLTVMSK